MQTTAPWYLRSSGPTWQPLTISAGGAHRARVPEDRVCRSHTADAGERAAANQARRHALSRRMNIGLAISSGFALWDLGAGTLESLAKTESGDWSSPGLSAPQDETMPRFIRMENGVRYQTLIETVKGDAAEDGDMIEYDYVLRRPNGYFIYSTVEGVSFQPRDLPVGPVEHRIGTGSMVPGLEQAMLGMHAGSRRRILVPPSLGYDPDLKLQPMPPGFAARRQVINHRTEPLVFEVEILRVKRPGK